MEAICAYLRTQKHWTDEQIETGLAAWRKGREDARREIAGLRIRIDSEGYLVWERFPELERLERVRILPQAPGGQAGPRSLIWLDPESGRQLDLQSLPPDSPGGLVVSEAGVYLHSPALETAPRLARSNVWVDTAMPDTRTHHVDLQVLPERELLFVLHREGGVVHVYHLNLFTRLASWQIRAPGSGLAINLTFDRGGLKAYLTDNVTPQLWIADLASLELKLWKSGLGVLGNILAAPEPGCLYITILKPNFNLIYFDLDSMSPLYSVEIRGEPLTGRRLLAWDPFMAAPDTSLLFYLAAREQSGQMLPVLNIIDADEVRTIKRTVVRSPALPILLVSGEANPFLRLGSEDFGPWLVDKGMLSAAELALATAPPPAKAKSAKAKPAKVFNIYQPPLEDDAIWEQLDKAAAPLELPSGSEDAIVDLISWAFYRLTLTNLRVHGGEMQKLRQLAGQLRQELQTKQAVLAKLRDVLGRFDFQTPISRATVLSLLEQRELPGSVRLEELCPICQAALSGPECETCGFCLDLPVDLRPLPLNSAEPGARLLPGQMLIPHPDRHLLLTLNLWRSPLAQVGNDSLKSIHHGVLLPSQNLLSVDSQGNKLVELSPAGEVLWKAKLALKRPVMATWFEADDGIHYIVVDQGNARVLELDRAGKHWRRYPTLKTPLLDKLTSPTDVQQTHTGSWLISDPAARRVLEVDSRGNVTRRFGPEQGLAAPVMARRRRDGSTEILDRELGAILRFDAKGLPEHRFDFWPQPGEFEDAPAPHWACLLHNGEWLILGGNYLLLVAPRREATRWIAPLPDPQRDDALLKVKFSTTSGADQRKKQLADYYGVLRKLELLSREPDEQVEALSRHVQPLSFDAGDWLLHPGELGNALFFVREGELEMVSPDKDQAKIFSIGPGQTCGSQAVLSIGDTSWRPGIRVVSDCKLLMLERGEFKKAVVGFPRLFHLVRHLDLEHSRKFKQFRERKSEQAQDQLRVRLNETRIRDFALFAGADDAFFEALAEVVHAVAYLPDQVLCRQGESGGTVFLILEGAVAIERRGAEAISLGEGEIFGEMAVLSGAPRSATIRTIDYCKFFLIDEGPLFRLCERFDWFGERLRSLAAQRTRINSTDWASFAAKAGLARPDLPFLELPAGPRPDEGVIYLPSLHHDAIAGFNHQGELIWFWGRESTRQLFHPGRVTVWDQRLLVTDTGNDRVLEIEIESRKVLRKWAGPLKMPRAATLTPEGLLLVADEGKQRLVVIDDSGREVWQYGLPEEILNPVHVEISREGHILFADAGMHRVYELSLDGRVIWTWGKWRNPGPGPDQLNEPSWVHRLGDGSTLIADAGNQRLVWLEPKKPPRFTPLAQLGPDFRPRHCQALADGDWLVSDPARDRLVRVNRRGDLIWEATLVYPDALSAGEAQSIAPHASAEQRWVLDASILEGARPKTRPEPVPEPKPEPELKSEAEPPGPPTADELLDLDGANETALIFWKELGIEIPRPSQAGGPDLHGLAGRLSQQLGGELFNELDEVLEQVSVDLESAAERETLETLSFLQGRADLEHEVDLGATLIMREDDEIVGPDPDVSDELDFLDLLMATNSPLVKDQPTNQDEAKP